MPKFLLIDPTATHFFEIKVLDHLPTSPTQGWSEDNLGAFTLHNELAKLTPGVPHEVFRNVLAKDVVSRLTGEITYDFFGHVVIGGLSDAVIEQVLNGGNPIFWD
ncbi:hypothetical protein [Zavarzinella formosa]|uniref:hypothetical protein n=1 Tax=Zavarzinella formosa TaxID=360055 RepID=UPI0003624DB6|nr:hypothetical protein [Zavarzinella formosa]